MAQFKVAAEPIFKKLTLEMQLVSPFPELGELIHPYNWLEDGKDPIREIAQAVEDENLVELMEEFIDKKTYAAIESMWRMKEPDERFPGLMTMMVRGLFHAMGAEGDLMKAQVLAVAILPFVDNALNFYRGEEFKPVEFKAPKTAAEPKEGSLAERIIDLVNEREQAYRERVALTMEGETEPTRIEVHMEKLRKYQRLMKESLETSIGKEYSVKGGLLEETVDTISQYSTDEEYLEALAQAHFKMCALNEEGETLLARFNIYIVMAITLCLEHHINVKEEKK